MNTENTSHNFRTVEILGLKGEKVGTVIFAQGTAGIQMLMKGGQLIMKLEKDHVQIKNRRGMGGSYCDDHGIQRCENCNQKVALRKQTFNKTLVTGGIKLREHAIATNSQTVRIADIAHKLTKSEYCNVNHLVRFGLAFKNEGMHGGEYGIPRKRRQQFIDSERKVADGFTEDPTITEDSDIRRRTMSEDRIFIHEVKNIQQVKQQNGGFFSSHKRNECFE